MISHTIFWLPTGLKISYEYDAFGEYLVVEDLNPETKILHAVTPWQLMKIGFKCLYRSVLR